MARSVVLFHLLTCLVSVIDFQADRVNWYDCEFDRIDDDGKLELKGLRENMSKKVSIYARLVSN